MRKCWNRQTGTFEVRVSMTCGFKSHLPHQKRTPMAYPAMGVLFFPATQTKQSPPASSRCQGALRLWKDKENRRVKA